MELTASEKYENTINKLNEDGLKFGMDLSAFFNMEIKKEIEQKEIEKEEFDLEK